MGTRQGSGPLASIIIDNYNYGRFLPAAIESALQQTYPRTEVLVVDDGSTDGSREVIAAYGARVIPVLKENGGQMSAFNAGFAASHGDIVCVLDADDVAVPHKVAVVVRAWQQNPAASMIYHQLKGIDTAGNSLWGGKPWPRPFCQGEIRDKVERAGGWWLWPNTSGLCFPRWVLERILPGPESGFRYCADTYLATAAPFLGPVVGLPRPLTSYRLHGHNWVMQFATKDRSEEARTMVKNYEEWFSLIRQTLQDGLGINAAMSLDDHYLYQIHRRNAGEPASLAKILTQILACPVMPPKMKAQETLKVLGLRRW